MNTALVIIDVQQGLFNNEPRPYQADQILQNINSVIDAARQQHWPVIFFQAEHPEVLPHGSEAWQLHSQLRRDKADLVLAKTEANAFVNTDLDQLLKSLGIDNIVLCGYSTEFCIDSTLRYASALGYTIQLVTDAHTTHDKAHLRAEKIIEHHNVTLGMGNRVTKECSSLLSFVDTKRI